MNMLVQTQLLTVGEVALRLRQSPRSVREKINAGEIPAVKIGSGPKAPIRVDAGELEAWLFSAGASPEAEDAPEC
jgi:excisionase family DNA binding protein